jgi:hypothetical protein
MVDLINVSYSFFFAKVIWNDCRKMFAKLWRILICLFRKKKYFSSQELSEPVFKRFVEINKNIHAHLMYDTKVSRAQAYVDDQISLSDVLQARMFCYFFFVAFKTRFPSRHWITITCTLIILVSFPHESFTTELFHASLYMRKNFAAGFTGNSVKVLTIIFNRCQHQQSDDTKIPDECWLHVFNPMCEELCKNRYPIWRSSTTTKLKEDLQTKWPPKNSFFFTELFLELNLGLYNNFTFKIYSSDLILLLSLCKVITDVFNFIVRLNGGLFFGEIAKWRY